MIQATETRVPATR